MQTLITVLSSSFIPAWLVEEINVHMNWCGAIMEDLKNKRLRLVGFGKNESCKQYFFELE